MNKKTSTKIKKILETYIMHKSIRNEFKKIKDKRRQKIIKEYKLSKEEKKQIDSFYKEHYGKKIPYYWHREYSAFTKKFDYKYMPEFIALPMVEKMFNDYRVSKTFSDKSLLPVIVGNLDYVYTPKIIASQTTKFNMKYENDLIGFCSLVKKLNNIGRCFIKPAKDTNSGSGCRILDITNGIDRLTGDSINSIIENYEENFIIEEMITNSLALKLLHPESLNTFRVITYMLNNNIYLSSAFFKNRS